MPKSTTHFEQIPIKTVKKIAQEEVPENEKAKHVKIDPAARKSEISRVRTLLESLGESINLDDMVATCGICAEPIELETCKIDEYGVAVHDHCVVARLVRRRPGVAMKPSPRAGAS